MTRKEEVNRHALIIVLPTGEWCKVYAKEIGGCSGLIPELGASLTERIQTWISRESNMARMAHGIPKGVDRRKSLGNAVVPQIPEMFAHRIRQALEAA